MKPWCYRAVAFKSYDDHKMDQFEQSNSLLCTELPMITIGRVMESHITIDKSLSPTPSPGQCPVDIDNQVANPLYCAVLL